MNKHRYQAWLAARTTRLTGDLGRAFPFGWVLVIVLCAVDECEIPSQLQVDV
jgi:hypothetical protein